MITQSYWHLKMSGLRNWLEHSVEHPLNRQLKENNFTFMVSPTGWKVLIKTDKKIHLQSLTSRETPHDFPSEVLQIKKNVIELRAKFGSTQQGSPPCTCWWSHSWNRGDGNQCNHLSFCSINCHLAELPWQNSSTFNNNLGEKS